MPRPTNLALKVAIIASGRHQQDIARDALIEPQKLSHAIYGRRSLMIRDQKRLAKILHRTREELFPPEPELPLPQEAAS